MAGLPSLVNMGASGLKDVRLAFLACSWSRDGCAL